MVDGNGCSALLLREEGRGVGWVSFCYLRILAKGPTGHDEYEVIQNTGKGFLIGIVSGYKLSFRQPDYMPTHLPSSCARAEELYCPRFELFKPDTQQSFLCSDSFPPFDLVQKLVPNC